MHMVTHRQGVYTQGVCLPAACQSSVLLLGNGIYIYIIVSVHKNNLKRVLNDRNDNHKKSNQWNSLWHIKLLCCF